MVGSGGCEGPCGKHGSRGPFSKVVLARKCRAGKPCEKRVTMHSGGNRKERSIRDISRNREGHQKTDQVPLRRLSTSAEHKPQPQTLTPQPTDNTKEKDEEQDRGRRQNPRIPRTHLARIHPTPT